MQEFTYIIKDEIGIHARPAALLVKCAKGCQSQISLMKGNDKAEADKLMAVMRLGVKQGESVIVQASGETEAADIQIMRKFFEENV